MSLFADAGRPRWSNVRDDSASNDYEDCSIDESLLEELEIERDTVMELVDNAEEEQFTNVGINKWLVDVKHIIYDADTLLDEINTEAQFKELYEADGSYSSDTLTEFERVATGKIKQITKKLVNFAEVGKRRGLKPSVERRAAAAAQQIQVPNARLTSSVLAESVSVHCRKKEKEEIVKWVCSSPDPAAGGNVKVDVMAIIGMGGLGKTTLARFVYNHPCAGHFRRSWACVSDKLDLVRVTKDILESLTEHPVGFCSLNTLQQELKKELEGKKFLIVLDDVWESSKEILENLMAPFSSGAKGSKIIITTRDQDVASIVSAIYDRLALKPMSEEEGWSLFSNDVFRDDDLSQHAKLEVIGKKIVKKCGGLPLAIKTLGGVLRSERDEIKWKGILESSFWKLRGGRSDIVPALALSYTCLPSHLKTCFAYCSLFPKGYRFLEGELVDLWIDVGFVKQSNDNTSVEDVGKTYFKELLSRSFFTKQGSRYVMHDLMHDLALMVCADFHLLLDGHAVAKDCKKVRHVSFYGTECNGSINTEGLTQIRSLQTFLAQASSQYPLRWELDANMLQDVLLQQQSLRVLCLRGSKIRTLPDKIGDLKLLRCLDVSFTDVEELPVSLGKLHNLRQLLCDSCDHLRGSQMDMLGLVSLRRFTMSGKQLRNPPQNLSHLTECSVTLEFYLPYSAEPFLHREVGVDQVDGPDAGETREESVDVSQVEQADGSVSREERSERRELLSRVRVQIDKSCFCYWVKDKHFASVDFSNLLESLRPHRDLKEIEIESPYDLIRFPDWLVVRSYHNIEKLRLIGCRLSSGSMPALGQLPYLKILDLSCVGNLKRLGREFYNCDDPFRSLEKLDLYDMEELEDWEPDDDDDDDGAVGVGKSFFPCLEELCIWDCPRLKGRLPAHLPSLRELSIAGCPRLMELNNEYPQLTDFELTRCGPCLVNSCLADNKFRHTFTSLVRLNLGDCDSVESFPAAGSLPPSLTSLKIENFVELKRLDGTGLHSLSCLEKLGILDCPKLEALLEKGSPCSITYLSLSGIVNTKRLDEFGLQNLTSLQKLSISECPKLEALPEEGLPCSLTELTLKDLKNLKTLDDDDGIGRLQNLTSLQQLRIWNCPELETLPEEGLPRSLDKLWLVDNHRKLKERCKRDSGPYWPKIAHIPHIDIW